MPDRQERRGATSSPVAPEGRPVVTPRIVARDSEELVEFVKRVFGASGEYRDDGPTEMRIGDSMIMISEAGVRQPMTAFLYVYVGDTDAAYRRALDAGARSLEEPAEMPYGDRRSMVEDKWGNTWQIATHRPEAPRTARKAARRRKPRPKSRSRSRAAQR